MDIVLGGDDHKQLHPHLQQSSKPSMEATLFLKQHPMAKIIVVVDTHCLENGAFVYEGDSPANFKACLLPEVGVFQ